MYSSTLPKMSKKRAVEGRKSEVDTDDNIMRDVPKSEIIEGDSRDFKIFVVKTKTKYKPYRYR